MPCRLPKAGTDINIWGLAMNDALRVLSGAGRLLVELNGNNPPTVKQGSTFLVYKEHTYLTPTGSATGNNVYPADTSMTYPVSEAVFEPADRAFAFGDTNFPAAIGASKTYYLWCSGGQDTDETSQGKGTYGMDETAPTWDDEKMGWYNASGYRVIATVKTTSGSVMDTTSLRVFNTDDSKPWMVDIMCTLLPTGSTGYTPALDDSSFTNSWNQSVNQNDEIYWYVALSKGTWTFQVYYYRDTNRGIATVSIDDTTVGTVDMYGASQRNTSGTIASISITRTGVHKLKIAMATKNGSSSGYRSDLSVIRMIRTA